MSSHRLTAHARRARLLLAPLEDRTVPTQLVVDPAVDMAGAVQELRDAITNPPPDNTVRLFGGGVYVFSDTINGDALPTINQWGTTKSTTQVGFVLDGNGATLRRAADTVDAKGKVITAVPAFRFVTVSGTSGAYARAVIRDLTFDNGSAPGAGGAVRVSSNPVDFDRVRFVNNKAGGSGGAVAFLDSNFDNWQTTFSSCLFANNSAAGGSGEGGGAVALSEGNGSFLNENTTNYVFTQSQFTGNKATAGNGGALLARDDDFFASGCSFVGNTAAADGGGLYVTSDAYRTNGTPGNDVGNTRGFLENSTVYGNTASRGGGLFVDGGWTDLRLLNDTVNRNTATGSGGGGIHWAQTLTTPEQILIGIQRFNGVFVRVELGFTVVAENTSPDPSFADLRGWFFDVTAPTQDRIQVGTARGFGTNFVGVLDPGVTLFNTDTTQQVSFVASGTSAAPADPLLAVDTSTDAKGVVTVTPRLQDNGGGVLSRLPRRNSPLIDRGPNAVYQDLEATPGVPATADQRGGNFRRIVNNRLDIGAVEVQAANSVALVKVSGDNQATATRAAFAAPLVLRTLDRYGDPLPGQTVTAAVSTASAGATFPLGNAQASDLNGYVTLYAVANETANTYNQLVTIGSQQATFRLTNRERLNFVDAVAGNGQQTQVATAFGTDLKVQVTRPVTDADGNVTYVGIAGVTVSFLATSVNGDPFPLDPTKATSPSVMLAPVPAAAPGDVTSTAAGGLFVTVTTDKDGYATAKATANTKASHAANDVTVLASVSGVGANGVPVASAAVPFFLTNTPGDPSKLTFLLVGGAPDGKASGSGQSALVPNLFDKQLAVLAGDQFGNPAPGRLVTFTSDPASPAQVTFPNGPTATTDAQGIARVTVAASGKAGTATVTATAVGLSPVAFTLINLPGLPAALTPVGGNTQSVVVADTTVGTGTVGAFAQPLVVEVRDAGGNPVPGAAVTFQGPGLGAGARFVPVVATTGADGRASVTAVPNSVSGTYTVTASVQTGNSSFASTTFTLTNLPAGAASVDVVSGGGQSAQAGSPFGQPVVVRVLDRFQNPVPGVTPTVTSAGATFVAGATGTDGLSQVLATAGGTAGPTAATVRVAALPPATFPLTVTGTPPGPPVPPVGLPALTAVGLDAGLASRVTVYNADGSIRTQFAPFDPGFLGGSRVAIARTPTTPTVVVVPGPGRFPDAQVFSANDGTPQASYQPFEQTFTGGLFVAAADIDRDGWEDYAFSPDQGGGPRVQIRSGRTGAVLQDFFGIDDPNFRGGARTALGDVNGDGVPDLIVAAGFGGGPRIAVYDGKSLTGFRATPVKLVGDFFAFEQTLRNGAYVAAGDVTGDGVADVVLGGGPGGGPRVRVLNGAELVAGRQAVVSDFFAGPSSDRGGIRLAVRELDETPGAAGSKGDIVTGSGAGDGSRVSVYLGKDLRAGQPVAARGFDDLAGFRGGVFVG